MPDTNSEETAKGEQPANSEIPAYIIEAAEASNIIARQGGSGSHGRKFGPQASIKLLMALREGLHYEPACAIAGVNYSSFRDWQIKAEDEPEDGPYATFARAVKLAEGEAELGMVSAMRKAGTDSRFWAANARILESRHPERWLRAERPVQVNVGVTVGIQAGDDSRRGLLPDVVLQQTFASAPLLSPVQAITYPVDK